MGLGAPKRRSKLSHDPNNTTWSRSTDTYGHKILSRQGWTPGSYLGATDASHSDHYTAANASHIRVLLREDNLGLGATVGKTNAETFGLSLFSGVLGRLNGKSEEELQKQQDALKDAELKTWHEQRYGLVGFVRGGWLVGDRIVEENQGKNVDVGPKDFKEDKKSKKRKAEDDTVVESGLSTKKLKKDKGSKQLRSTTTPQGRVSQDVNLSKPASKEGSGTGRSGNDEDSSPSSTQGTKKRKSKHGKVNKDDEPEASSSDDDRAKRKAEKRARKEARRKRKEEKAAKNAKNAPALKDSDRTGTSGTSTPQESASTGYSTPVFGRQAVRQRYIQQKRMASMDPQAMREIFMLKAAG